MRDRLGKFGRCVVAEPIKGKIIDARYETLSTFVLYSAAQDWCLANSRLKVTALELVLLFPHTPSSF